MESVMLSSGVKMPVLGYGVYQVAAEECERCVLDALKVGYRSLDTAQSYFNEAQVGSAMRKSGVPREEIFLTTKVWVEHYGYEAAKASVLESMEKLQTDYLDLVLLHQPFGDYYGAYRALEDLYIQGRVRAIGVSNFYPDRLVDLASFAHIRPMVNQVEIHPYHQQAEADLDGKVQCAGRGLGTLRRGPRGSIYGSGSSGNRQTVRTQPQRNRLPYPKSHTAALRRNGGTGA